MANHRCRQNPVPMIQVLFRLVSSSCRCVCNKFAKTFSQVLFCSFAFVQQGKGLFYKSQISGQSYKASTIVIYESTVVNMCNLLVTTTRVVIYEHKLFARLATDDTHCKRKDHCTAGLQFNKIGFDQKLQYVVIGN